MCRRAKNVRVPDSIGPARGACEMNPRVKYVVLMSNVVARGAAAGKLPFTCTLDSRHHGRHGWDEV